MFFLNSNPSINDFVICQVDGDNPRKTRSLTERACEGLYQISGLIRIQRSATIKFFYRLADNGLPFTNRSGAWPRSTAVNCGLSEAF